MLAIWGTDALAVNMFNRISKKEQDNAFFVAAGASQTDNAAKLPRVVELSQLPLERVTKLIIPSTAAYGTGNILTRQSTGRSGKPRRCPKAGYGSWIMRPLTGN